MSNVFSFRPCPNTNSIETHPGCTHELPSNLSFANPYVSCTPAVAPANKTYGIQPILRHRPSNVIRRLKRILPPHLLQQNCIHCSSVSSGSLTSIHSLFLSLAFSLIPPTSIYHNIPSRYSASLHRYSGSWEGKRYSHRSSTPYSPSSDVPLGWR